jgi:hypothetical protein
MKVGLSARDNLDDWVNTLEFEISCDQKARELAGAFLSDDSEFSVEANTLWSASDSISTATAETDSHEVSKLEAYFYYAGIGPKGHWPRLVHRDSPDIFEEPTGPEAFVRHMRLANVPADHEFTKNKLWEKVRDWVRDALIVR